VVTTPVNPQKATGTVTSPDHAGTEMSTWWPHQWASKCQHQRHSWNQQKNWMTITRKST